MITIVVIVGFLGISVQIVGASASSGTIPVKGAANQSGTAWSIPFGDTITETVTSTRTGTSTRTPYPTATSTATQTPIPACGFYWRPVSIATSQAPPNSLEDIDMLSLSEGWSVGATGGDAHIERWSGTTWNQVPPPPGIDAYSVLNGVSGFSSNQVWAVGSQGPDTYASANSLVLRWNGSQWTVIPSPNPGGSWNALYDVEVLAEDNVWAVGTHDAAPFIVHWDGGSWTVMPLPNMHLGPLRSIYAVNANDIWVVGEGHPHQRKMNILHWDGVAWRTVIDPVMPPIEEWRTDYVSLYGVHGTGPNDIWAIGNRSGEFPVTLHWDGSQWTNVLNSAPSLGYTMLTDVVAVNPDEAWAVGFDEEGTFTIHWDGSTWSAVLSPTPGFQRNGAYGTRLLGVTATRPGDVWAVGFYQTELHASSQKSFMIRYNDPCTTPANTPTATPTSTSLCEGSWQQVASPNAGLPGNPNYLMGIDARTATDIWAVGYYSNTLGVEETLIQRWNGTQWATIPSPETGQGHNRLYSVTAVASNDAWAVGSYRTFDNKERYQIMRWNGAVWSIVAGPDLSSEYSRLSSITAISANDVWAVGYYYAPGVGPSSALALHWNGSQWTVAATPAPEGYTSYNLLSVSALASNDVWAVGSRTDFATLKPMAMHWDGSTWQLSDVPDPIPNSSFDSILTGVVVITPDNIWAVGYQVIMNLQATRTTLLVHWDGTEWSSPWEPTEPGSTYPTGHPRVGASSYLMGVTARAQNDIWAVGYYKPAATSLTQTLAMQFNGQVWGTNGPVSSLEAAWALHGTTSVGGDIWAVGYYEDGGVARTLVERYVTSCPQGTTTPIPVSPTTTATATATATASSVASDTSTAIAGSSATAVPSATAGTCAIRFADVPASGPGSTFYSFVRCLACRNIISGYQCGGAGEPCNGGNDPYFRPGLNVTRGQISKMVALAANLAGPTGNQIFEDVKPGSTFYDPIQQLASRGYIGGYPCGRVESEPCEAGDRSYFRPGVNTTRGQLSKIVSETARFVDAPGTQKFADVPEESPFFTWINRLANRGVISGYTCGGPGEACDAQSRPYFRPNDYVTRGQTAKIVANTFYPNCQTP